MYRKGTIPRVCEHCKKDFLARTDQVADGRGHFCSKSCAGASRTGPKAPGWKRGSYVEANGYVFILRPDSPMAKADGYVPEHRLIMAEHIGRCLTPDEVVHHINEQKQDNRIENLQLLSRGEHTRLHSTIEGWTRDHDACTVCGTTERRHEGFGMCFRCLYQSRRGFKDLRVKLTPDQVREIRKRYAAGGVCQRDLAKEFGVSKTTIGYIVRRRIWVHVD